MKIEKLFFNFHGSFTHHMLLASLWVTALQVSTAIPVTDSTVEQATLRRKNLRYRIFSPVLMLEGKAAGTWKRTLKKDQELIHISPFTPIDPAHREAVLAAAAEYGAF